MKRGALEQHKTRDCGKFVVGCEVEGCSFQAERGATGVWQMHMADIASNGCHLLCAMRAIKQQNDTITQLTTKVQKQEDTNNQQHKLIVDLQQQLRQVQESVPRQVYIAQLLSPSPATQPRESAFVEVFPRSVDWVVRGITSKWTQAFREFSQELCFNHIPNPSLRYSFKLCVDVNFSDSKGHIGVFFIPRRGRGHTSLTWPINNHIQVEALSVKGGAHKTNVMNHQKFKEFFAKQSPPDEDNTEARGFRKFLSKSDVESGEFVMNDGMIVRVTLLDSTF